MEVNPLVFETSASTDSAIWANGGAKVGIIFQSANFFGCFLGKGVKLMGEVGDLVFGEVVSAFVLCGFAVLDCAGWAVVDACEAHCAVAEPLGAVLGEAGVLCGAVLGAFSAGYALCCGVEWGVGAAEFFEEWIYDFCFEGGECAFGDEGDLAAVFDVGDYFLDFCLCLPEFLALGVFGVGVESGEEDVGVWHLEGECGFCFDGAECFLAHFDCEAGVVAAGYGDVAVGCGGVVVEVVFCDEVEYDCGDSP